ncbi:MAG: hypothetical protein FH753_02930 [Firmicutes bacterium]|nr:hypothetical protein [Bacillota bacterium]
MKGKLLMVLIIFSLFTFGCKDINTDKEDVNNNQINELKLKLEEKNEEIDKLKNENEKLKGKLSKNERLYTNHYHFMEVHNECIYYLKRVGDTDNEWTDELLRYDKSKGVKKLYSAKGIDYRVSSDNKKIAVEFDEKLVLLNDKGEKIKTYSFNEIDKSLQVTPNIWSDDGKVLYGSLSDTYMIEYFFKIENGDISYIKNNLELISEYVINPNTDWICYSDYPVLLDTDAFDEFKESKKSIKLYLYNFSTKEKIIIDKSVTKKFSPVWIDDNTIEYNDPSSDKRKTYKLK